MVGYHRSSADGERAERAELTTELGKLSKGAEWTALGLMETPEFGISPPERSSL